MKNYVPILVFLCLSAAGCKSDVRVEMNKNWTYAIVTEQDSPRSIQQLRFQAVVDLTQIVNHHPDRKGFLFLKNEFAVPAELSGKNLSFLAGRIIWADQIYINGHFIGATGSMPPETPQNFWNITRNYSIPTEFLQTGKLNTILIKVYVDAEGGLSDTPVVGETGDMANIQKIRDLTHVRINLVISLLLPFVGTYHLLIYLKRRKDRVNLYYSGLLFAFGLYNVNMFIWSLPFIPAVQYLHTQKILFGLLFVCMAVYIKFLIEYLEIKPNRWLVRGIYFLQLVSFVVLSLSPNYQTFFTIRGFTQMPFPLILLLGIYWTLRRALQGMRDARHLLLGMSLIIIPILHDLFLVYFSINNAVYLSSYGFPAFLFSIAFSLANKFVNVHNQVEELNITLEEKVTVRTAELSRTLDEVNILKEKQDGDYFLTSLLLAPLGEKRVGDGPVKVEFFTRQKKVFHFRKWNAEIGGDLTAAHEISLRNKKYTVFMNGDAMGKSIQGAGGALVLGTIFKSIVTRTQIAAASRNRFPEQWLKECFLELQNVFISFDGTMTASMFLGVIENETGLLYFFNAEHPFPVVYRNANSTFIPQAAHMYKIGVGGLDSEMRINIFSLQSDDVIIVGSDGRDDIAIGMDAKGNRMINEDETLFLSVVSKCGGNLEKIVNELTGIGEITDDLSLIRIGYREDYAVPPVSDSERKELEKDIKLFLSKKDYSRAVELLYMYVDMYPEKTKYLYYVSEALKRTGDLQNAADYGERCRLREPDMPLNILNLSEIYFMMGNQSRAVAFVDRARKFPGVQSRIDKIEKKYS